MRLSADQQKLFENWLRQKIEHSSCTLCQSNHWKVGEIMTGHVGGEAVDDLSPTTYMVQLICKNCGHVLLFDTRYIKGWGEREDMSTSGFIM
jgi:predicted nucleic-acid-binding Zn-ribbon protein